MTLPTYLTTLKARLQAATDGPWTPHNTFEDGFCVDIGCEATHADLALIANAPTDLARCIAIIELQNAALEYIAQNPPMEEMKSWAVQSLLHVIHVDADAATEAIQAADKIASGGLDE